MYFSVSSPAIMIYRQGMGGSEHSQIASRDPEAAFEFHQGRVYFNPLLKEFGSVQPYIFSEEKLSGIFNGRSPKKVTKTDAAKYARGWFEIPPQPLSEKDLPTPLYNLIRYQPRLVGAIRQVSISTLGLRIPDDLNITDMDGWLAWIKNQQMPIGPKLKAAFQAVFTRNNLLVISPSDHQLFLTGTPPEPTYQVKVRWYRRERVHTVQDQLFESSEWDLASVSAATLKEGRSAILAETQRLLGPSWNNVAQNPAGITKVSEDRKDAIEGALIWFRPVGEANFKPLVEPGETVHDNRPLTINDLFREAINEQ